MGNSIRHICASLALVWSHRAYYLWRNITEQQQDRGFIEYANAFQTLIVCNTLKVWNDSTIDQHTWNLPKTQSRTKPGWLQGKSLLPSKSFHFPFPLLFTPPFSVPSIKFTVKHPHAWTSFSITSHRNPHPRWNARLGQKAVSLWLFCREGFPSTAEQGPSRADSTHWGYPAPPPWRPSSTLPQLHPSRTWALSPAQPLLNISAQIVHFILKRYLPEFKNSHFF